MSKLSRYEPEDDLDAFALEALEVVRSLPPRTCPNRSAEESGLAPPAG